MKIFEDKSVVTSYSDLARVFLTGFFLGCTVVLLVFMQIKYGVI